MYQVIGHPRTRTMRVLWALEELGVPYEHDGALPRSDVAREHNPSGKIPVLIVDGRAIIDSVAIAQFLADRHGDLTYPAGSLERAEQDSFTQFAVDEVDGPLWTRSKHTFALPEEIRVEQVIDAAREEFRRAMALLETRLGDRTYVMGERFTVPDIVLGHCAGWAASVKFELPGGTVGAYFERVRARPALQRVLEMPR